MKKEFVNTARKRKEKDGLGVEEKTIIEGSMRLIKSGLPISEGK